MSMFPIPEPRSCGVSWIGPAASRACALRLLTVMFLLARPSTVLGDGNAVSPEIPAAFERVVQAQEARASRNLDRALAELDAAAGIAPAVGTIQQRRAHVLLTMGRRDEAIAALRKAVALNPRLTSAWQTIATVQCARRASAREAIDAGLKAYQLSRAATDLVPVGTAYRTLGRLDQALFVFEQLPAGAGETHRWLTARGDLELGRGNPQRAISLYEAALQEAPNRVEALAGLARAFGSTREAEKTAAVVERGLAMVTEGLTPTSEVGCARAIVFCLEAATPDRALARTRKQPQATTRLTPYLGLFSVVALMRAGQKDRASAEASRLVRDLAPGSWPRPIAQALAGEVTPEALWTSASGLSRIKPDGQLCEAAYYAGEIARAGGDEEKAREYFSRCLEFQDDRRFFEYDLAVNELRFMK